MTNIIHKTGNLALSIHNYLCEKMHYKMNKWAEKHNRNHRPCSFTLEIDIVFRQSGPSGASARSLILASWRFPPAAKLEAAKIK
jgi:hypothetical protein